MRLEWDRTSERFFETGVSKGVLYLQDSHGNYPNGVAWNGLISVTNSPSGSEPTDMYADDIKYASLRSAETFGATIEAYTYPDEFSKCDGSDTIAPGIYIGQQFRQPFGFCYKTLVNNDTAVEYDDAYKIHIIYNATASPSERQYNTKNESPEAITMSWELTTTPISVPNFKVTASMEIDSRKCYKPILKKLEDILYGTETTAPRLPLPEEILKILSDSNYPIVELVDGEIEVMGVAVDKLCKSMALKAKVTNAEFSLSGVMSNVTGFTAFDSTEASNQSGSYFVISVKPSSKHTPVAYGIVPLAATGPFIKVESVGNVAKPVENTDYYVVRVADNTKPVVVTSSNEEDYRDAISITLDITGMTVGSETLELTTSP